MKQEGLEPLLDLIEELEGTHNWRKHGPLVKELDDADGPWSPSSPKHIEDLRRALDMARAAYDALAASQGLDGWREAMNKRHRPPPDGSF